MLPHVESENVDGNLERSPSRPPRGGLADWTRLALIVILLASLAVQVMHHKDWVDIAGRLIAALTTPRPDHDKAQERPHPENARNERTQASP